MSRREERKEKEPAEVVIRVIAPEEWQAYKSIRLEALRCEPQAFGSSYADAKRKPDAYWQQRLVKAQAQDGDWLFFAEEKGAPVGMIGAFMAGASDSVGSVEVADIISVYVTSSARGRGVATRLMTAVLAALASSASVKRARLMVNKEQKCAVTLYEKFGFTVVGEEEAILGDGKAHSEFIMEKRLKQ